MGNIGKSFTNELSRLLIPSAVRDLLHPVLYEQIDGAHIRKTALRVQGASGLDAYSWRCIC